MRSSDKKIQIKSVIITVVAALLFAFVFIKFIKAEGAGVGNATTEEEFLIEGHTDYINESVTDAYDVVFMGDSMLAYYCYAAEGIPNAVAADTGLSVCDVSLGGTYLAYSDTDATLDNTTDAFSMAALTQAKISDDYRYQNAALDVLTASATDYFRRRIAIYKGIDFSKTKVLFIGHMINDYHNATSVESGSDKYDEYTYEGALRSVISDWKEAYPDMDIVLLSPPTTWYLDGEKMISSHEKDYGAGIIDDYKAIQIKVADEYNLDVIDFDDVYKGMDADNISEYSIDGLHPTYEKSFDIAGLISDYLNEKGLQESNQ